MAVAKNKTKNEAADPPKKGTGQRRRSISPEVRGLAWGIVWLALSAFLFLSMTVNLTGRVGEAISSFGRGMMGGASFALPLVPLYAGIQKIKGETRWRTAVKVWSGAVLLVALAALLHIMGEGPGDGANILALLYKSGVTLKSGGVLGGLLGMLCLHLFARVGASIIIGAVLLVCILLLTEVTPAAIIRMIKKRWGKKTASPKKRDEEGPDPVAEPAGQKAPFKADIQIESPAPPIKEPVPERPVIPAPVILGTRPANDGAPAPVLTIQKEQPKEAAPEVPAPSAPHEGERHKVEGEGPRYTFPPLTLLKKGEAKGGGESDEELRARAVKLVDTLKSFGVETRVTNVCRGPSVTRYELAPNAGVKVSRIVNLSDDIALNLAAPGVRIEAPIPGKAAVGIEVPNEETSVVPIREILESSPFKQAPSRVSAALGKDILGNPIVADLSKMPHLLIAGATGSGKSVCINTLITSILYKATPDEVRLLMIDPKVVELGGYNGIPHLLIPVVTDPKKAAGALSWAVGEMMNRYKLFNERSVRDFKGYNTSIADAMAEGEEGLSFLPQIVIIIDELADLMMAAPRDVEDSICRLAQMARAAGMHLVIATQRPSVDVITGIIKANIPSRISFAVSSQVDSRTILDMAGAEKLLGRGDMLYYPSGVPKPIRVQGCFISDREVEAVVDFIKKSRIADYNEDIMEQIDKNTAGGGESGDSHADGADEMLPAAIEVVVEAGMASVSLLQRRLKLGYARAARIVDEMEERGIVGPYEGSKPRTVLITRQQYLEMKQNGE